MRKPNVEEGTVVAISQENGSEALNNQGNISALRDLYQWSDAAHENCRRRLAGLVFQLLRV